MKARTALFVCSCLAILGSAPLLALYVAVLNGFADVIGTLAIGAFGCATAALLAVPATVFGIRRMRSNPVLPKGFMVGSGLLSVLTLLVAIVFVADKLFR
jgi:hypothetical protein